MSKEIEITKTLYCKKCKKSPLLKVHGDTQGEVDKKYQLMQEMFGDTPCSNCVSPVEFAKECLSTKENNE